MSSDLDEDIRRVAALREHEQNLYARSVAPSTRRDAPATSTSRRRTIAASGSGSDDDDDRTDRTSARLPPKKKQKRVLPRFAGDGLSDDDMAGSTNRFFEGQGDNEDDDALWGNLDAVPNNLDTVAGRDATNNERPKDSQFVFDIDGVTGLGESIDNVDQVVKKKRVYAKLDEERLSSSLGFPKLKEIALSFKPKGKGHEFQDLKRMMSMYQLWAHRMFPKTNLADTLKTIEKVCRKRGMMSTLRQMRDEHKHGKKSDAEFLLEEGEREEALSQAHARDRGGDEDSAGDEPMVRLTTSTFIEVAGDDLWDDEEAIMRDLENDMAAAAAQQASQRGSNSASVQITHNDNDDDEEAAILRELEEEMAAASAPTQQAACKQTQALPAGPARIQAEDEEEDEEQAILRELEMEAEMERTASTTSSTARAPVIPPAMALPIGAEGNEQDEEDEEAILREIERQEAEMPAGAAATTRKSASPIKKVIPEAGADEDDLWAVDEEVLRELEANRS